jgi:hypothetical protein
MFKAWKSRDQKLDTNKPESRVDGKLLTRVMYDVAPYTYGTYEDLKEVLTATRGDLATINHSEFFDLLDRKFDGKSVLDLLGENGVQIGTRDGEVVEKTGLIALAGVFKGIANNTIASGSRVLCCLTSGARIGDGKAAPEYRVSSLDTLLADCQRMIYGA